MVLALQISNVLPNIKQTKKKNNDRSIDLAVRHTYIYHHHCSPSQGQLFRYIREIKPEAPLPTIESGSDLSTQYTLSLCYLASETDNHHKNPNTNTVII